MARNKNTKKSKGSTGANRNATDNFIEKYANKANVIRHEEGFYFKVIEQGDGDKPSLFDSVRVNQRILLADGSVIADTYRTGLADEFSLEEAIKGLKLGLPLMSVGSRYEFVIPPELAWGKKGNRSKIGPNAVMFFDIRLVKIV
ncbi:FKBP-type peptidyl-prolyl cis-trans isomerase [Psychrosphaera sp. B3R10]|uniref:FKBP-type peptidyl-prolyl cis-trans isomerase n=1 Tax=unclassified Psychrosphaera TaxID=2641570 RepID=UPI001C081224|nr:MULTISPECIES: FKBP-type peptidyl-prolyl cis-trans isomerase [unclassified Psychrosphaera]MBU2881757.1 FKBP-type peptidyl-prolyl cis-trans isomerase [Psychrosphaera sp. I2R16]MBU2990158.1 FKBP-type peptidyl-prolyl cis-trans isomerase [Psychrosphaera sp. B3R10]